MRVIVTFDVHAEVTWEQAYDAAEAMVTAAPVETGAVLTFDRIEVDHG